MVRVDEIFPNGRKYPIILHINIQDAYDISSHGIDQILLTNASLIIPRITESNFTA